MGFITQHSPLPPPYDPYPYPSPYPPYPPAPPPPAPSNQSPLLPLVPSPPLYKEPLAPYGASQNGVPSEREFDKRHGRCRWLGGGRGGEL
jgi:hypothetical protein